MMNNKTSHQYIMELKHGTYLDASRKGKCVIEWCNSAELRHCMVV